MNAHIFWISSCSCFDREKIHPLQWLSSGYFEKLRAFCTSRTHLVTCPQIPGCRTYSIFWPLSALSFQSLYSAFPVFNSQPESLKVEGGEGDCSIWLFSSLIYWTYIYTGRIFLNYTVCLSLPAWTSKNQKGKGYWYGRCVLFFDFTTDCLALKHHF